MPVRMHLVHTQIWRTPEGVCALTCCRLGFHFFGEALWEWLMLCPKTGPFWQIAQTFGMVVALSFRLLKQRIYHKTRRKATSCLRRGTPPLDGRRPRA